MSRCFKFCTDLLATAAKASSFGLVIRTDVVATGVCDVSTFVFFVVDRVLVDVFCPFLVVEAAPLVAPDVSPRVFGVSLLDDYSVAFSCSNRTLRACFGAGGADRGGVDGLIIVDVTVGGRCELLHCSDAVRRGDGDADESLLVLLDRRPLGGDGDPRLDGVDALDACVVSSPESLSTNSCVLYLELRPVGSFALHRRA